MNIFRCICSRRYSCNFHDLHYIYYLCESPSCIWSDQSKIHPEIMNIALNSSYLYRFLCLWSRITIQEASGKKQSWLMQDEAALALILSFTQPTTNLSVPALTISAVATDYGLTAQVFSLIFCISKGQQRNEQ